MPRPYGMLPALCLFALAAVALGGCDQPSGVTQSSPPAAAPTEPNYKDFGDFEIHYNALRTDELKPEVARAYGIERSPNRVMLNVSLLRKNPDGSTQPIDGTVHASAYNLNGQLKDL